MLEAEVGNAGALALYGRLGFVRDKRLHRYYLNGADAYRLKLLLLPVAPALAALAEGEGEEEEGEGGGTALDELAEAAAALAVA